MILWLATFGAGWNDPLYQAYKFYYGYYGNNCS